MFSHTGEIAGLMVALCWTMSALFFEKAGHKIGSLTVNVIRLSLAVVFLGITTFLHAAFSFPLMLHIINGSGLDFRVL